MTTSSAASTDAKNHYVLTYHCPERIGLVHALTGVLVQHQGNVEELKQFDDPRTGHFFFRAEFTLPGGEAELDNLRGDLDKLAEETEAECSVRPKEQKKRVLLMVSKFGHCLEDLLHRERQGELNAEIVAVVSNHPDFRQTVEWHGIPFFRIPVTKETKPEAEAQLLELVDRFEVDLVVLARYMQVLSDNLSRELSGKAINIHHSFLPSFKGAKPYHQAYDRGVKTVGATAHYVNHELDEGPIIAQQVQPVDHTYLPEDLVAVGRNSECKALADAVKWHCDSRVFLNGGRTVVLT
ncbi:MAG: formyltetrahydrofolate deformylase [Galactobacter sp.]